MLDIRIGVLVQKDPDKMNPELSKQPGYRPPDLKYIDKERHDRFVEKLFAIVNS